MKPLKNWKLRFEQHFKGMPAKEGANLISLGRFTATKILPPNH